MDAIKKLLLIVNHIEKFAIVFIMTFYAFIIIYAYSRDSFSYNVAFLDTIYDYLLLTLYPSIQGKDGTLVTIAAVFIGIYFTIFSLLGSIRSNMALSMLSQRNFERLLKYIFFAFLSSFSYLLISFFLFPFAESYLYKVVALFLLIYMFLTALRFGTVIFLAYYSDFKKFRKNIEKEKEDYIRLTNMINRIEVYLDKQDLKEQILKNEALKKQNSSEKNT